MPNIQTGSVLFARINDKRIPRPVLVTKDNGNDTYDVVILRDDVSPDFGNTQELMRWALFGLNKGKLNKAGLSCIGLSDIVRSITVLSQADYARVLIVTADLTQ